MATTDSANRRARATALTYGAIAEVEMAGVLLIWSTTTTSPGNRVSLAVLVAAMTTLALGLVVLLARARRAVSLPVTVVLAVATGGLAVVTYGALGSGVGILLLAAWVMSLPAIVALFRLHYR